MLKSLSEPATGRILAAVHAALDDGDLAESDPSAALAKAAATHGVPAGHARLAAHAYNTARSAWQRESGRDAAEKAAEFPVADAVRVVALLCPAGSPVPEPAPCRDYQAPPSWYKGATAPKPSSWSTAIKVAAGPEPEAARLRRDLEDARRSLAVDGPGRAKVAGATRALGRAVDALRDALDEPGSPSFLDVKVAGRARHGPDSDAAMDYFSARHPGSAKLAEVHPYHRACDHPTVYSSLAGMIEAGCALIASEREYDDNASAREKAAMATLEPWAGRFDPAQAALPAGSLFDPPPGGIMDQSSIDPLLAREEDAPQPSLFDVPAGEPKLAGAPQAIALGVTVGKARDALDSVLGRMRDRNDTEGRARGLAGKLSDPDHEAALSDIGTRAALGTMLSHDSVLSGYDPSEVSRAFNEISTIAPGLASRPVMVRPLLRKYLAMGHLDSFDSSEALKSEKGLRDLSVPPKDEASKPSGPEKPKGGR